MQILAEYGGNRRCRVFMPGENRDSAKRIRTSRWQRTAYLRPLSLVQSSREQPRRQSVSTLGAFFHVNIFAARSCLRRRRLKDYIARASRDCIDTGIKGRRGLPKGGAVGKNAGGKIKGGGRLFMGFSACAINPVRVGICIAQVPSRRVDDPSTQSPRNTNTNTKKIQFVPSTFLLTSGVGFQNRDPSARIFRDTMNMIYGYRRRITTPPPSHV